MPAGQGKDAERFAAAVESGTPLGAADDPALARDLEIVAMLRSRGAAYAPDPEAKARAKQRLRGLLAGAQGGPRPAPRPARQADAAHPAPLGRLDEREDGDPSAETALMEPVAADAPGGGEPDQETLV